jgi:hypothetical protein
MSRVSADREIAKVYARQANRAGTAAAAAIIGGVVASVVFALTLAHGNPAIGIGILALGAAVTATLYVVVSHLQARAEAEALRHLAVSRDASPDE